MTLRNKRVELRNRFLERRSEIDTKRPSAASDICRYLLQWLDEGKGRVLGFYWPIRSEPNIVPAICCWLERDISRVACLPVVESANSRKMHYARWTPQMRMVSGAFGIAVPEEDIRIVPDIVLSPCVAFNQQGYRLGYGGGFFDRYLEDCGNGSPLTMAVGYDALETDEFIAEKHDVAFDYIVTESGVRNCRL